MAALRRTTLHAFHLITVALFLLSCYMYLSAKGQETSNHGNSNHGNSQTAIIAVDTQDNSQDRDSTDEGDDVELMVETYDEEDMEVFQPTSNWQQIKTGQAIPRGLHIRMNLETGLKEAKLLDGDDGSKYTQIKSDSNNQPGDGDTNLQFQEDRAANNEHAYFTKKELKNALKNFKANQDDVRDKVEAEQIRQKYRSIVELKKDFDALNLNVETDTEIMQKLVKRFNASDATVETRQMVLEDLEYYVHQIDNARDLVSIGGFHLVLLALNDTEETIRREAAFVLGSAVQSNPHVQIVAIDGGAIQLLLRLISPFESIAMRKKAIYAMAALLRNFPYAQNKFIQLGGLSTLSLLFKESDAKALPLKVKAVTLLHDMLLELKLVTEGEPPSEDTEKDRLNQYKLVNLLPAMLSQGWCDLIASLLDVPDHDAREKILLSMQLLVEPCQEYYQGTFVQKQLNHLKDEYEQFASEEKIENNGEDYFQGIFHLVRDIMTHLQVKS